MKNLIFESTTGMEIPYDLQFMHLVLDWIDGLVGLAGASRTETHDLHLALDETLTFLTSSYPGAEPWERIRIDFRMAPEGFAELTVTNAGPPVHLERIPRWDPQAPSETDMAGMWYFLAAEAADEFRFENLGMGGWRAIIKKRLAEASLEAKSRAEASSALSAPRTAFSTRLAVPEDAGQLVDLTYDTYRYSYPVEEFYREPQLREALKRGEIISLVVEADGVIVGNSSFVLSAKTPRCAYSASLMVGRAFRQSRAIINLVAEAERFINGCSLDVDLYYGTMVTNHTGSQKAGAKVGFSPLALLLSVGVPVDYRGMKISNSERESFILYVRLVASPNMPVLYLPERHHAVMSGLLTQAGFDSALSGEEAGLMDEDTLFSVEEDPIEANAYITAIRLGQDWVTRLHKMIFALKAKGMQTIIILVPSWRPTPPGLDREMVRFNAVFTGLKPVSAKECYLVYSAFSQEVDFERIRILAPLAQELKEHIRRLYVETVMD